MATVEVRLESCPSSKEDRLKTFHIYPVGLTEKLSVNIELDCQCSCEIHNNEVGTKLTDSL
jgi:integrin beta 1